MKSHCPPVQIFCALAGAVVQTCPHVPQFALSVSLLVQRVAPHGSGVAPPQVAWHWPPLQEPPPQSLPQVPQFFGSFVRLTHALLQAWLVSGFPVFATQVPVVHAKQLPVQAVSQQWPSAEHVPLLHSWAAPQVPPGAFLGEQVVPLQ